MNHVQIVLRGAVLAVVAFVIPPAYWAARDLFNEPSAPAVPVRYQPKQPLRPLEEWVAPEKVLTPPTEISKLLVERFGL